MKKLLLSALATLALAGCSKSGTDPAPAAPALTGGTWAWTSETIVSTNKSTGAVTSQSTTVVPNTVTVTYAANGTFTTVADKSVTGTGANVTATGTYAYSGGIITYVIGGKTSTVRVDALTSSNLTTVGTDETTTMRYVTTDTYTR